MLYYKKGGDIMYIFYILGIVCFALGLLIKYLNKDKIKAEELKVANSPMTQTEINFINQLESVINKYHLKVLPQIQLQRIFKTNNIAEFNKIKSKSIDYAIVDNNYKYKLFIELDDYTHNYNNRIKRDNYINTLFKDHHLKLLRIKVKNTYNMTELEEEIKQIIQKSSNEH